MLSIRRIQFLHRFAHSTPLCCLAGRPTFPPEILNRQHTGARLTILARHFHLTTSMSKRSLDGDRQPLPQQPRPTEYTHVAFEDASYTAVKEGLARVLFPFSRKEEQASKTEQGPDIVLPDEVFYNPIQQFNRDLSVLAIKTFAELFAQEKRNRPTASAKRRKPTQSHDNAQPGSNYDGAQQAVTEIHGNSGSAGASATRISGHAQQRVKLSVLDALSATGLRALRYSLEIPDVTSVTSNDLDPSAVKSIERNIEYNKLHGQTIDPEKLAPSEAMAKINVNEGNARNHMYSVLSGAKYEVIDLDPYGSAAPFLDAAVQAVSDGGLLCVTCTDAGVWASVGYSEKCMSTYGGIPAKAEWKHEAGLRLILHCIASSAGRYGLAMEPLLSLSIDYYARVFVRIRKSPAQVKNLASSTMIVYNCDEGCGSWYDQRLGKAKEVMGKSGKTTFTKYSLTKAPSVDSSCPECGFTMHLAGPMWGGPLHSLDFVTRFQTVLSQQSASIYGTIPRMMGMLESAAQEAELNDCPFFHVTDRLSRAMHTEAPPLAAIRGALIGLGYQVARSHCRPVSFKTNAPHEIVWDVMKKWVDTIPRKGEGLKEGMAGFQIMLRREGKDLSAVTLDEKLGKDEVKSAGAIRYQINPTANWGPMGRAKGQSLQTSKTDGEPARKKNRIIGIQATRSDPPPEVDMP